MRSLKPSRISEIPHTSLNLQIRRKFAWKKLHIRVLGTTRNFICAASPNFRAYIVRAWPWRESRWENWRNCAPESCQTRAFSTMRDPRRICGGFSFGFLQRWRENCALRGWVGSSCEVCARVGGDRSAPAAFAKWQFFFVIEILVQCTVHSVMFSECCRRKLMSVSKYWEDSLRFEK